MTDQGGEITVTVDGKPGGLNSDDIRVITESYKIDGIGDPKVKRPFIGKIEPSDAARFIYKNSGVCFHLGSDEYSLEGGFSSLTDDERSKILNDEGIIGLLKREAWPGRKETIFALFKAKNVSAEIQQKYENEDSAPSDRIGYQIKEQPAVDAKYQKVSKLFKKYCVFVPLR
jgi:hypothetical protein